MRITLLSIAAVVLGSAGAARADVVTLPVVLHVADATDEAWLSEARGLANHHFAEAHVAFAEIERRPLPDAHARLSTIADRRRLERLLVPRAINVFVVESIRDPVASAATRRAAEAQGFAPSGWLGGAHIRSRSRRPDTYIIVSRSTRPLVVTHELGHFLGAPHHRDPQNIMSYGRDRQRFEERQLRTFRMFARRHLRRGTLRRVRPETS